MQQWQALYTELCEKIGSKIPSIKWQDLWHNQVNFLDEEHPFPTPSVFYQFIILNTQDTGLRVQKVTLQVNVYLFYETFSDTYQGSWNQDSALSFLDLLTQLYAALHASDGTNYSNMRRIGFRDVDSGNAGNLYLQSFTCELMDYAAQKEYDEQDIDDISLSQGNAEDDRPDDENGYVIPG